MRGGNTGNGFDKNPKRASEAGKKSKRKSWHTIREKAAKKIKSELGVDDPDELAIITVVKLMLDCDLRAAEHWLDRELGRTTQKSEITGADGEAINSKVTIEFVDSVPEKN